LLQFIYHSGVNGIVEPGTAAPLYVVDGPVETSPIAGETAFKLEVSAEGDNSNLILGAQFADKCPGSLLYRAQVLTVATRYVYDQNHTERLIVIREELYLLSDAILVEFEIFSSEIGNVSTLR